MLRLRQLCLVAGDLDPAVADLEAVFSIATCYHDPAVEKFGLVNALLPVGNNFLEVAPPSERRRGRGAISSGVVVMAATWSFCNAMQ